MQYPEFHYHWEWDLQSSPEALWPLVTDTNRFNRDTGVPSIENRATSELGNARRRLRLFRLGVPVEWEEEPFEWVRPRRFGVKRRYLSGPVAEMRVLAELTPTATGGTHLVYQVWARPANLLGLVAIPAQVGLISARSFDSTFKHYNTVAATGGTALDLPNDVEFVPGGKARLMEIRAALSNDGADAEIVERLTEVVEKMDAIALARLRPYEFADRWNLPRREVLEHFLMATRRGMFELQWDVLCPMCRNVKVTAPTLGKLQNQVHCATCNVDITSNFDRSIELTFRPNANIRETERGEFCIAGPQTTPHVNVQQLVPAGQERIVEPILEPGRYRLRTLEMRGGEFLRVEKDGIEEVTLRASTVDGWPEGELSLSTTPKLHLKNVTDEEQLFILERTAWSDTALTAAEVTVSQTFRDLFASEALRPGEQISVGSLTIIFTDLRGSTRLYNEIGDAPAFGLVMNHFDVLKAAINAEGGAIVKTIGDAVMAVFQRPAPALRALLNAQSMLAQEPEGERSLKLRAGVHYGPCIAVTLNERLDYFGSTVNMAARLESFSSGGDVIISEAVRTDPEVRELLGITDYGLAADSFEAQLKGFETAFSLWRVKAQAVLEVAS